MADIIVEIPAHLREVLGGIVIRARTGDAGICGNGLVPRIAVGKGEAVAVVAVHGLVGESRLCCVTTAEDRFTVRVAAAAEAVHALWSKSS